VIARDEAETVIQNNDCDLSNCDEVLNSVNSEIGKALLESKQDNYVYIYNHFTNAWKFAENILGANLKKESSDNSTEVLIPSKYDLSQNYPNPFNPSTTINYQLPENNHVTLQIYDIIGNLVTTLLDQDMEAGYHSTTWNAGNFASGVYFYRLVSGTFVSTKKLLLMK
jgi:Secretion system C-terminal sorting domain